MIMLRICVSYSILVLILSGCAGTESFSRSARVGDTVAVAVGWWHGLSRDNITIEILPGPGQPPAAVYGPNDPAIRAIANFYPDPLSSLLVSPLVGEDLTPAAQFYADTALASYTGGDKDMSETIVFLDLPAVIFTAQPVDMQEGIARISVSDGNPETPTTITTVRIVPGQGSPSDFGTVGGGLNAAQLQSLERVANHTVTFTGLDIPHALQVSLVHDPDRDNGGVGKAHVVNTRGDLKNVAWHDDGVNLEVVLTSANNQLPAELLDFKFYVAGGVTGLSVTAVQAYDINGNVIAGISAGLTASP